MKFSAVFGFIAVVLAAPTGTSTSTSSSAATSSAQREVYQWDADWNKDYTIHASCNDTQYAQISAGIKEAKILAAHARDRTLRYGNSSEFFVKYFGEAATAEVIGWYDFIVNGDQSAAVFRCDNPDGNCDIEGWAGHWRGTNGSNENVICDLSYTSKLYLSQMCSQGYTVAGSKTTAFWSGDLLHRLWHTDVVGQGVVSHYADTYNECLELAKTTPEEAVRNSATLRYYALDVYAYDIAIPGVGCTGKAPEEEKSSSSSSSSASSASAAAEQQSTSAAATTTTGADSPTECHTHSNGETHCS